MAKVISSTYDPESELYTIEYDDGSSITSGDDIPVGTSDGNETGSDKNTSSGLTTDTAPTRNSYDFSGYTYTKNPDGTYVKIDESGVSHPSTAEEFEAAASGKDPATLSPTLDSSKVSTTPTTSRTTSTVTGTGDPNTFTGLINRAVSNTLSAKDIANFAAANAGNIAAMTGLAALTGGNTPTTGAYTGKIPTLQSIRSQVNAAVPPGQSQQYFTDTRYVNPADAGAVAQAKADTATQAQNIIAAAQQQAAAKSAAQPVVPGFAMPWVNQTAAGNTPVTAANNAGLAAVIDRSSPGYNYGSSTGASISPGQNVTITPGKTAADAAAAAAAAKAAADAAALKAQQDAAAKAAADAAALKAQQDAAAKAAAEAAAAKNAADAKAKQDAANKAAADAAALKAQQDAAAKAAADKAAADAAAKAAADKAAADKAAADKAAADAAAKAAAAKTAQQQTDIGNIVKQYTDPTGKITDPTKATQMQVAVAQYMDANGITPGQLTGIVGNASYATGWTPDLINTVYKSVDPIAQVVTAYQGGKSAADVAALANKDNITLQQLQSIGLNNQQINDLAAKGYLGTGATSSPLLTSLLAKDYSNASPADIANINAIAAAQQLTTDQVQKMFPGIDLYQVSQAGVNVPGYVAPTQTLQDMYTKGDVAGINNLLQTQNINANDVTSMFNGIDLNAIANQGINIPGYTAPVNTVTSSDNTGIAATNTANFNNFINNVIGKGGGNTANVNTNAAPSYTDYSNQNIADYIAQNNIDVNDPAAVAAAVQQTNADPNAVNSYISSLGPVNDQPYVDNSGAKAGGLMGYAHGGISNIPRYLQGTTDGMADKVPSSIDGVQPAKLSHGEFVIPADVVSHLGNGNSDAGAKKLYEMMDRVRYARTGTKKQGKEINPDKFMVGGHAYAKGGEIAFSSGGVPGYAGTTGSVVGTSSGVSTPSLGYSTVNALSPWAGDYVTNMLGSAQALAQGPMPVYQGELTAGPSALQQQQFSGLSALAQTGVPPVQFQTGTFSNAGAPVMPDLSRPSDTSLIGQYTGDNAPDYSKPLQLDTGNTGVAGQYMNPYLQQSLQPQLDLLARQSQINTLGDLGKMTQQGAFGGSRQAVLQGINEGNLLGQQANLIGQGYNTAYKNAMDQFNAEQSLGLQAQNYQQQANQGSANFGLQSLNALGSAGATQQGLTQAADTAAQNQFNQQALYPYQQLQFEQSMLSNLPISTQAVIPNTSPISNAAGALNTSISLADALAQLGIK
jgi:hypothetical protein